MNKINIVYSVHLIPHSNVNDYLVANILHAFASRKAPTTYLVERK